MASEVHFDDFRAQFPVLEHLAYLNAGTEGPVSRRTAEAVRDRIELETTRGRCGRPYFEELMGLASQARAGYASLMGCQASDVALTGSTTDGVNTVVSGLRLKEGDEILTSDQEHPGLLAPLGLARRRDGVSVRLAPFDRLVEHVGPQTRLIACSHVSWVSGQVVDARGLADTGVPVVLDGAQGLGAVPVDVGALGCHFYAASGQKWLCGPEGSGCLYVSPEALEDLLIPWPGYSSLADPSQALELEPAKGAARLDHGFPSGLRSAWVVASLAVLGEAGWDWIHERAASQAQWLADRLTGLGLEVRDRGRSTLVSWHAGDSQEHVQQLAAAGIVVRNLPALDLVRASVGAWSSEEELERLAQAAGTYLNR